MNIKKVIKKKIKKHREIVHSLIALFAFIPDKYYLRIMYRFKTGKKLNLDHPQTFNEKLQWLKLYDRRPEYTVMVDKFEAKKYIADKIGEKYIIPTLGVWDKFDDIDFELLPDQFVLKCTHDSGGLVICQNKRDLDIEKTRKKITRSLRNNYYYVFREWPYKNIKPRIIAEKYMADGNKIVPEDYKVYCINGEPKYIVVFHNRFSENKALCETVYDTNWIPQRFSLDEHFAVSYITEDKPECLKELLNICKILCRDIPQVRIDFYIIEEKIYFGEMTLYTASGLQKMIPEEMDEVIGKMVQLPSLKM
ncbi:MAG: glycosyl transferase [Lachnospiraceae bacterium]|nr:glycosyl transferase [Lachnospiraceae bacterium]